MTVARLLPVTDAEGPGRRTALWVQGCSIRCPGCFNPHLWTNRGGSARPVTDLAEEILGSARATGVEGITLLGGEPFEQAAPLGELAVAVRSAGLSVMTFTGYLLADLRRWAAERADIAALLDATDLLADGPYLAERPERRRPWIGSENQGLHPLSDRYADRVDGPDRVEVRVGADGSVAVNGWADLATLEHLLEDLGRRARAGCRSSPRSTGPRGAASTRRGRSS